MTDTETQFCCGAIFLVALFSFIAGGCIVEARVRKQACNNGVAHYVCNPTNGETKFEWKR